jgi:hypothetical protein
MVQSNPARMSKPVIEKAGLILTAIVDLVNDRDSARYRGLDLSKCTINESNSQYIGIDITLRLLTLLVNNNFRQQPNNSEISYVQAGLDLLEKIKLIRLQTRQGSGKRRINFNFNQTDVEEVVKNIPKLVELEKTKEQQIKAATSPNKQIDSLDVVSSKNSLIPNHVYQSEYWIERGNLSHELQAKLTGNCRLLLLVGISGIGKTAQAEKLVENLRTENSWIEIRCNFENDKKQTFSDFAISCIEKNNRSVSNSDISPDALLKDLAQCLIEYPYLILLDSAEYLLTGNDETGWGEFQDILWCQLFSLLLSAENCQSRIIITSQDDMTQLSSHCHRYHRLWDKKMIRGWAESEQIAFFHLHFQEIDMELLKSPTYPLNIIGRLYDGHPLVLEVICGEIKEVYDRSVDAYWQEYRLEIEQVSKDIEEAITASSSQEYKEDRWQLHSYTATLKRIINKRLGKTIERLQADANLAYLLLCLGSNYRIEVSDQFWLRELKTRGYLDEEKNQQSLELLSNRYLIKSQIKQVDIRDDRDEIQTVAKRHLSLHNLIRSLAIAHRVQVFGE